MYSGRELHSIGIGMRKLKGLKADAGGWDGHLVTTCNGILIDTVFPVRPAWDWASPAFGARIIPRRERPIFFPGILQDV